MFSMTKLDALSKIVLASSSSEGSKRALIVDQEQENTRIFNRGCGLALHAQL